MNIDVDKVFGQVIYVSSQETIGPVVGYRSGVGQARRTDMVPVWNEKMVGTRIPAPGDKVTIVSNKGTKGREIDG